MQHPTENETFPVGGNDIGNDSDTDSNNDWWDNGGSSSFSDWFGGITQGLESLGNSISGGLKDLGSNIVNGFKGILEDLFVPTYNPTDEINNKLTEKYSFITQIVELTDTLFQDFKSSDTPPTFAITYKGNTMEIINFEIYKPYRATVNGIIIAISWVLFVMWVIKFIPQLLRGV